MNGAVVQETALSQLLIADHLREHTAELSAGSSAGSSAELSTELLISHFNQWENPNGLRLGGSIYCKSENCEEAA